MTPSPRSAVPARTAERPPAAVRAAVIGNYVDQLHIFLPLAALTPVLPRVAGTEALGAAAAIVMIATLLGRPVGAVVLGWVADRVGRTRTTCIAIAGTAAASLAVAAVPEASAWGGATIAVIVAARFLGGAFLAGEYSAAIPLAMEWADPRRRGRWSGRIMATAPLAQGTIAAATALLVAVLGIDAYAAWGWRALFVAGALASLVMLARYLREVRDAPAPGIPAAARNAESAAPHAAPHAAPGRGRQADAPCEPAGALARRFWRLFLLMTGLWLLTQVVVIQLTGRLAGELGMDAATVAVVVVTAALAQAGAMALAGAVSDRVGRRPVFVAFAASALVLAPPLWFVAVSDAPLGLVVAAAAVLQASTVAAYGPVGAHLAEAFPARVRSTGYGAAYSVSLIVPALHPFYLPLLEGPFGHAGAPVALLVIGAVCLALGARFGVAEGGGRPLDAPIAGLDRGAGDARANVDRAAKEPADAGPR